MINALNQAMAERIAASAATNGIRVFAVENTIVGDLVRESVPVTGLTEDVKQSLLAGVSQLDGQNVEGHDELLDTHIKALVPGILNQISFAKNVVGAAVGHAMSDITQAAAMVTPRNLAVQFVYLSSAVNSAAAVSLYEPFKTGAYNTKLITVADFQGLRGLTSEAVAGFLKTNLSTFDQDLIAMVSKHSDGWLHDVFMRYFIEPEKHFEGGVMPCNFSLADELLAALIITMHLLNNVPDNINLPLVQYQGTLNQNVQSLSRALAVSVDSYWRAVGGKQLILTVPVIPDYITSATSDIVIPVLGPVMEQLMSDGGSADTVLGLALANVREPSHLKGLDYGLQSALDHREQLDAYYQAWWAKAQQLHVAQSASIIRAAMEQVLVGLVTDLPEDKRHPELPLADLQNAIREQVRGASDVEVNTQTYTTVQRILGSTVFSHSNALDILTRMDAYGAKFPGIDAREASYMAIRDIVVEWLFSMADVSPTS